MNDLNKILNEKGTENIDTLVENETRKNNPGVITNPEVLQGQNMNHMVNDMNLESYFDGGLLQQIGWRILGSLVTLLTFGICFPWAVCMMYRWETKHTVINGHRLVFDGKAIQLLGNWIKWGLLTIITCGIFGLWVPIKLKKWETKHTRFM